METWRGTIPLFPTPLIFCSSCLLPSLLTHFPSSGSCLFLLFLYKINTKVSWNEFSVQFNAPWLEKRLKFWTLSSHKPVCDQCTWIPRRISLFSCVSLMFRTHICAVKMDCEPSGCNSLFPEYRFFLEYHLIHTHVSDNVRGRRQYMYVCSVEVNNTVRNYHSHVLVVMSERRSLISSS